MFISTFITFLTLKLPYSYFEIIKDLRLNCYHRIFHVKLYCVLVCLHKSRLEQAEACFIASFAWLECEKCGFDQQQRYVRCYFACNAFLICSNSSVLTVLLIHLSVKHHVKFVNNIKIPIFFKIYRNVI